MGYRFVPTLRGAISLIAKALDMPYDDIAVYGHMEMMARA